MDEAFKALSDPTRRAILRELRAGARSAGELAELFPLAKSTLSGHFNVLRAADLVTREKRGTSVLYRLNATVFDEVLGYVMDLFGVGMEGAGVGAKGTGIRSENGAEEAEEEEAEGAKEARHEHA